MIVAVNIESKLRLNPDYILYCMCKPVLVCPLAEIYHQVPSQKFSQNTGENRKKEDGTREKLRDDTVTQCSRESRTLPDRCAEMDNI